jgi:hypothetical protein
VIDPDDAKLLHAMADEARAFLERHAWCERVADLEYGDGVGGIVAVFLATIVPAHDGVDERLWVIVGDVPPLYLVTEELPTPRSALRAYLEWRREWIEAVRDRRPTDDLPAIDMAPTEANAEHLAVRLDFIESAVQEWQ